MKVLFLGSSRFSVIVLNRMIENGINVCAVVTQNDKPAGRGHKLTPTEVKSYALEKNINVFTFDKIRNHIEEIKNIDYDLAVVASFGQILPQSFLDIKLTINVHPSLLPKYRGASPIQSAILNGDEISGVTIMKVAKEVDSGDIILQKEYKVSGKYYKEVEEELGVVGGDMLNEVIKGLEKGVINFTPQNHEKAVLVQKISKEDGQIDLNKTSRKIENQVRALSENVGCFIKIGDFSLKIGKIIDVSSEFSVEKGIIANNKKRFIIGCQDGSVEILSCQAPSGKMISGKDFLNGHNDLLGKRIL